VKVCYRKTCTKCFFKTIFRPVLLVSFSLIINNQLLLFNLGEWQDESKTLADMKRVWISKKFSYIYEACPSTNLAFFMQSVYAHCVGTYLPGTCSSDLYLTIFIFKNSKCKLELWFFSRVIWMLNCFILCWTHF
jgi:hypothetical protein